MKAYCKKKLLSNSNEYYTKSKYYNIQSKNDEFYIVTTNYGFGLSFKIKTDINSNWNFEEYFYTQKKLRKIKIKKLNEK